MPSITTTLERGVDGTIENLISSGSFVINKYNNLPGSYNKVNDLKEGISFFNTTVSNSELAYSGSCETLKTDPAIQIAMIDNLQKAFSGTVFETDVNFKPLIEADGNKEYIAQNIIERFIDKNFVVTAIAPAITYQTCADGSISQYMCADTSATRFTILGTWGIKDNITGLEWQQDGGKTPERKYNWAEAKTYCANLTLGGKTDWRLPDVTELTSILDYSKINPSIDGIFTNTASTYYWSSTTSKYSTSYAWSVDFSYGYSHYRYKTYGTSVRCTR